jgi:hypothetical protein
LIDVEDVAGDLAQLEGEAPAVHGLGAEELEREHLERAANDLGALVGVRPVGISCRYPKGLPFR